MNFKLSIMIRVRVVFIWIALLSALLPYKINNLQLVDGDVCREKAETINVQYREVPATRGNIYARDGSLLATSLPFYRVALDPTIAKSDRYKAGIDSLSRMLSAYYKDKSSASYKRMIHDARLDNKRYLVLNRKKIGYQAIQVISNWPILRERRLGGGMWCQ